MLCGGGARSAAGRQAPAPGEAVPARNQTLSTQPSRAWGPVAPEPAAGLRPRGGAPAAPAASRGGPEEGVRWQNPEQHPSLRPRRRLHLLPGPARAPDGDLVPGSPRAWGPPRRPAAPRVRTSRLPARRRRPCPPAARQGSQRRGRACERASGRGGRCDAQTLPGARRAPACSARPGLARPPPSCALRPQRLQDGSRERRGPRLGRRRGGGGAPGGPRGLQRGVGSRSLCRAACTARSVQDSEQA